MSINEEEKLVRGNGGSAGESLQKIQDFVSVFEITAGQFSDDVGMASYFGIKKQSLKPLVAYAQMIDPDGSIYEDHSYAELLRLGVSCNSFSVPPRRARRLALSLATSAFNPRRTSVVFSLTPVNSAAFSSNPSSMFNVVLICINMHLSYANVNGFTSMNALASTRDGADAVTPTTRRTRRSVFRLGEDLVSGTPLHPRRP